MKVNLVKKILCIISILLCILLTACGNDRGGGDYREGFPGYEHVGTWAFDIIEISDKAPKDYTSVNYEFRD